MEQWKQIDCLPGYPGTIEVSDAGRVRLSGRSHIQRNRWGTISRHSKPDIIVSGEVMQNGYRSISLRISKKRYRFLVHRLVAQAFVSGYSSELSVNHINGDKLDNRAPNLEWVTLAVNTQKQWETGLIDIRGEKHPSVKLKDAQVLEIVEKLKRPGVTYLKLAKEYGVSDSLIYKIRKGKRSIPTLP